MKDGGPAFPVPYNDSDEPGVIKGMSLRDYFAGKALPQVIASWCKFHIEHDDGEGFGNELSSENMRLMAEDAYELADHMLTARTKS